MPNTTKRLISDEVLFRLYGGRQDVSSPVQKQDIFKATEQWINSKYKFQHLSITLPSGETIPDSAVFATYENVAVTSYGDKSKSTLPVMPISMPKNIGIFDIYDANGNHYIPLQKGQGQLLRTDELLNSLFGQVWYEPSGNTVIYSQDLTLVGITSVTMVLAVFDMAQYGETDVLPMPSDMEADCVNDLVAQFSPVMPESGQVNNYTTAQKQPNQ